MQIALDARFYGPSGKGLGRYIQKLIEHLGKLENDHRFTILLRKENWSAFEPQDQRFTKVLADYPWYSVGEQLGLPRLLNSLPVDLVHFPHYNVPLLYRRPFVVTIHDLIVSRYPTVRATTLNPLLYRAKHAAYQMVLRSAVRRARHILTVSHYSKKVIEELLAVPREKISVTYEAAESPHHGKVSYSARERFRRWMPFALYVGNAYPHKNLENLVRAFALIKRLWHEPFHLVLVGKMDYFYSRIARLVRDLGLQQSVIFPGYVSDEELAALYDDAFFYVFPSFEEGFGLPALEAMRAGLPVASSNRSCLPEVLGDAAEYFAPERPETITVALLRLLRDGRRREELRALGRARADHFHWDDLARSTLNVYTTYGRHRAYEANV